MKAFNDLLVLLLTIGLVASAKSSNDIGQNTKRLSNANRPYPHPKPWSMPHANLNLNQMRAVVAFRKRLDGSFCQVDVRKQSQFTPSFIKTAHRNTRVSINNTSVCSAKEQKSFKKNVKHFNLEGVKAQKTNIVVALAGSVLKSAGIGCVFGSIAGYLDHKFGSHGEKTVKKILEEEGVLPETSESQTEAGTTCLECEREKKQKAFLGFGGGVIGAITALDSGLADKASRLSSKDKNLLPTTSAYLPNTKAFRKELLDLAQSFAEDELRKKELRKMLRNPDDIKFKLEVLENKEGYEVKKRASLMAKIDKLYNTQTDPIVEEMIQKNLKQLKAVDENLNHISKANKFFNDLLSGKDNPTLNKQIERYIDRRQTSTYLDRRYTSVQNLSNAELIAVIKYRKNIDGKKLTDSIIEKHSQIQHKQSIKELKKSSILGGILTGIVGAIVCEDGTTYFLKDNPKVEI